MRRILWGAAFFALAAMPAAAGGTAFGAWETDSADWEPRDPGAIRFDTDTARSFAWSSNAVAGAEIEMAVTLTPERRTSDGWLVAGPAVRYDDRNYWGFHLVEAPDDGGRRHYVELTEMLDGRWLAQHAAETRLESLAQEGTGFDWKYGRPYRMKLTVAGGRIEGTVAEEDGAVRARIAWKLSDRSVTGGVPCLTAASCAGAFAGFVSEVRKPVTLPAPERPSFPPYAAPAPASASGPVFRATGFFRAEKEGGRWWLADPLGHPFFLVGTDHVRYEGHWCEKLGYAPYSRVSKANYANEQAWGGTALSRLKGWGFNALTAGHSESLRHRALPHIEFLSLGASFAGREALCEKTTWTGFPDVFSPRWARHCDQIARRRCAPAREDPWLIGYFLDNELEWFGKSHRPEGLFEEAWKLPETAHGKRAWADFVATSPGGLAAFNAEFGTAFADAATLLRDRSPRTARGGAGAAMAREWVRRVAEAYFGVAAAAARRHDPNHMVLGCRFAGRAPDVLEVAGRHCDVVTFNIYPRIDVERGVPADVLKTLDDWQAGCGRPMMITEWSFPALDAGLPSRHGAGMRVDTQAQRAACFSHFQEFLFRLPYVVGSCYFMYLDEPAEGISSTFPEDSNYGLIDVRDKPYPELTAAAAGLNPRAAELHLRGGFTPAAEIAAKLPAWAAAAPGKPLPLTERLERTTGRLRVAGPEGAAGWRMFLGDAEIGRLLPMIHQVAGGKDSWTRPAAAKIVAVREDDRFVAADMEFAHPAGAAPAGATAYRVTVRWWIPKSDAGWIAGRALRVENTGTAPWRLAGIFHALDPVPSAGLAQIEPLNDVPNHYLAAHAWIDRAAGRGIGCWFVPGAALTCNFWKDSGLHPDLRQETDVLLAPGASFDAAPDPAFYFALPEPTRAAYGEAVRRIRKDL